MNTVITTMATMTNIISEVKIVRGQSHGTILVISIWCQEIGTHIRSRQFRLSTKWFFITLLLETYASVSSILKEDPRVREGRPSFCRIDVGRLIAYICPCVCVYVFMYACMYVRVSLYEWQASSSLITKIPTFENARELKIEFKKR